VVVPVFDDCRRSIDIPTYLKVKTLYLNYFVIYLSVFIIPWEP